MRPLQRPDVEFWEGECLDSDVGPVRLTGQFLRRSAERLVVVQHGLGGSVESGYMALALREADRLGVSCLLLNSRGADRSGADIYHSGLIEDLSAALSDACFDGFREIDLFGYSIGGHLALRYAMRDPDPRVRRVVAVGSPIDLRAAADDFDALKFGVYRTHVLDALKEIYTAAYQRNPSGIHPEEARKVKGIREWDEKVIAPRFGYAGADAYYVAESAAGRLQELKVESLYIGASSDPMVLAASVHPHLVAERLSVHWDDRAGHLGFSDDFDLGLQAPLGLESQAFAWLSS